MLLDALEHARRNISARKLRSGLTVLGIIIGIMAIVSLVAVSNGLENAITHQLEQFGKDTIMVTPKSYGFGDPTQSASLTTNDADAIERLGAFDYVAPMLMASASVEFRGEARNILIEAMNPRDLLRIFSDSGTDLREGRMLSDSETSAIVIGSRTADVMFSKKVSLQNRLVINGRTFVVVGILEPVGNQIDDEAVYMPLDTARVVLNKSTELNAIMMKPKPGQDPAALVGRISRALERERGDKNFEVMTAVQLVSQIQGILGIVKLVLAGIAAISLVVGGIGIMNSMYTSVLERTQEIGLMKSVGAKNSTILFFFILESGLLGAIGGIIGTTVGSLVAIGVQAAAEAYGFQYLRIMITPDIVLLGVGFAAIAGAVSGAYPAKEAAKMQPIEALRQYV